MAKPVIKHTIRRIVSALPGGGALLRARANYIERRRFARIGGTEDVFRSHYESGRWNCGESVSGPGSTLEYTENIRKKLPPLLKELGVSVILDAPCGDYNWIRTIDWETPITYVGADIVEPLVQRNQSRYGSPHTRFIHLDIVHEPLPEADLWLCRDCLPHLSHYDIFGAIDNFLASRIPYLLTSTYPECVKNYDTPSGAYRDLNLLLSPFEFGEPLQVMDDWIEGYPVRQLGLWEREVLKIQLASNRHFQRLRDSRG
ncbi:MAG: class I SAM-dependent methyltransferase [Candidatus Hydrogenedentes bacterium]|nr:class I SAM-dependent methyltransferase [Candidatus Hydrogenedentota bacterium]